MATRRIAAAALFITSILYPNRVVASFVKIDTIYRRKCYFSPTLRLKENSLVLRGGDTKNHELNRDALKSKETHHSNDMKRVATRCLSTLSLLIASIFAASSVANAGGNSMFNKNAAANFSPPRPLKVSELAVSSSMVVVVGLIMRSFGLNSLSKSIILSAVRCAAQLLFVGAFVLNVIFGRNSPVIVLTWLVLVGVIASHEASSRVKYSYKGMERHALLSLLLGAGVVLCTSILGVLKPFPWWNAKTLVPVGGMIFGNCLSAASLGLSALLMEIAEGKDRIELRLARGATIWEAARPVAQNALSSALMPVVNALSATGIIHMPGMMTGQILGGQTPTAAAAYQVMIMFALAASSCATVLVLTALVMNSMFDISSHMFSMKPLALKASGSTTNISSVKEKWWENNMLYSALKSLQNTYSAWFRQTNESSFTEDLHMESTQDHAQNKSKHIQSFPLSNNFFTSKIPILKVENLYLNNTKLTVSFALGRGDRLGIIGKSGVGKTMLLRTIACLNPMTSSQGQITLFNTTLPSMKPYEWRSRILWVSQDRPTLPGTPRDFYEQTLLFRSQQHKKKNNDLPSLSPEAIAANWSLPNSIFQRSWSTLSGGEAQRASLAIALALRPDVLLLDEPTSACDNATALAVEETLRDCEIPIVMVSHQYEQVERFCTHCLTLS